MKLRRSRREVVEVTTDRTPVARANARRRRLLILNRSGQTVYCGPDPRVDTVGRGYTFDANGGGYDAKHDEDGDDVHADWYGVVPAGTAKLYVSEWEEAE